MIMIYVTYPSEDDAKKISRSLVERRLVACANVVPAVQSLYWWDGKVQEDQEVAALYKTQAKNFEAVKACVLESHPYDVPCIVSYEIKNGHEPYLSWIQNETDKK